MPASINALANLTGVDRRTIKKRLSSVKPVEDGLYSEAEAIRAIFSVNGDSKPKGILESEARIAAAKAIQEEVDAEKAIEKVIEIDVAEKAWDLITGGIRQKLLSMPTKIESLFRDGMSAIQVRGLVEVEIDEILTDLSKPIDYSESERIEEAD